MIKDPVVWFPDPILRKKARDVTPSEIATGQLVQGDSIPLKQLVDSMSELAAQTGGIGLAAPQVGLSVRIFVVKAMSYSEPMPEFVAINPVIIDKQGEEVDAPEGCLSLPRITCNVARAPRLKLQYTSLDGGRHDLEASDLLARVIQHEYDHLEGTLIIDRIGTAARFMLRKKLERLERTFELRNSYKDKKGR